MHSRHIPLCKKSMGCCQNHWCITLSNMNVLFEVASPRCMQDISAPPIAQISIGPKLCGPHGDRIATQQGDVISQFTLKLV